MLPLLWLPCFLLIVAFWNFIWKRRGLPPGPTPLPFFGNTIAMKRSIYEPFQQWTREFGPIYTVWMGEMPIVMVTEFELMRDLFVKDGDAYAGREFLAKLFKSIKATGYKNGGIIRTQGEPWKVMRRFGLQTMRNLGMGRAGLERKFLSDIGQLCVKLAELDEAERMDFRLQKDIDRLIGSTINRVLFGYGFQNELLDEFHVLKGLMDANGQLLSTTLGRMIMVSPWLRHLPFFANTHAKMNQNMGAILAFNDRPIQARIALRAKEANERGEEEPKDLLDYFLDQMELTKQGKGDPEQMKHFTLDNLRFICFDLFLAGQETTSRTLSFLVLYLMLDQRVQAKLHKELDDLEGQNGNEEETGGIGLADKPKLPFLNAIINESQRLCNLLPLNLAHRTMCDVQIMDGKFKLPKDTIIVPQISCVLFDERIFPNPLRFEPERFLDENGQLKRCEELVPFGMGKRICMGESLARMELFLFTANFFRRFKILPVDPLKPPSTKKVNSFGVGLKPYNCRLIVRNRNKMTDEH